MPHLLPPSPSKDNHVGSNGRIVSAGPTSQDTRGIANTTRRDEDGGSALLLSLAQTATEAAVGRHSAADAPRTGRQDNVLTTRSDSQSHQHPEESEMPAIGPNQEFGNMAPSPRSDSTNKKMETGGDATNNETLVGPHGSDQEICRSPAKRVRDHLSEDYGSQNPAAGQYFNTRNSPGVLGESKTINELNLTSASSTKREDRNDDEFVAETKTYQRPCQSLEARMVSSSQNSSVGKERGQPSDGSAVSRHSGYPYRSQMYPPAAPPRSHPWQPHPRPDDSHHPHPPPSLHGPPGYGSHDRLSYASPDPHYPYSPHPNHGPLGGMPPHYHHSHSVQHPYWASTPHGQPPRAAYPHPYPHHGAHQGAYYPPNYQESAFPPNGRAAKNKTMREAGTIMEDSDSVQNSEPEPKDKQEPNKPSQDKNNDSTPASKRAAEPKTSKVSIVEEADETDKRRRVISPSSSERSSPPKSQHFSESAMPVNHSQHRSNAGHLRSCQPMMATSRGAVQVAGGASPPPRSRHCQHPPTHMVPGQGPAYRPMHRLPHPAPPGSHANVRPHGGLWQGDPMNSTYPHPHGPPHPHSHSRHPHPPAQHLHHHVPSAPMHSRPHPPPPSQHHRSPHVPTSCHPQTGSEKPHTIVRSVAGVIGSSGRVEPPNIGTSKHQTGPTTQTSGEITSVAQWQAAHEANNGRAPSANRCVPLKPPIPSRYWGDVDKVKDAFVPDFHQLVNYPDYLPKNRPVPGTGVSAACGVSSNGMRRCVMCGKERLCTAAATSNSSGVVNSRIRAGGDLVASSPTSGDERRASPVRSDGSMTVGQNQDGAIHIIPRQNKGLCTACDVTVWVLTSSNLEIKWCKGCKNFRPWAAFGDKGLATKCVRCRDRQREKYATQKEGLRQKRQQQLKKQISEENQGPTDGGNIKVSSQLGRSMHQKRRADGSMAADSEGGKIDRFPPYPSICEQEPRELDAAKGLSNLIAASSKLNNDHE